MSATLCSNSAEPISGISSQEGGVIGDLGGASHSVLGSATVTHFLSSYQVTYPSCGEARDLAAVSKATGTSY